MMKKTAIPLKSSLLAFAVILLTSCSIRGGTVQSFAPDVIWGGRTVAVSVHPLQPDFMLAASDSGGVFRSSNGGRTWPHAQPNSPRFWSYTVRDIAYCPLNSRNIIATTYLDLSTTPNGGIWLSRNGGISMRRPTNARPAVGPRCPEQSSAYGISFDPETGRAYVGTDCGYAWSDDCGESWTHKVVDPSLPVDAAKTQDRILNIVSAGGGRLYAVGKNGVYYSSDNGSYWNPAASPSSWGNIPFRDAPPRLAVSPDNPLHAFLALDDLFGDYARLYITLDGGRIWDPVRADENGARQAIVLATPHNHRNAEQEGYTLYWGNGPKLFRTVLKDLDRHAIRNISWEEVSVDHPDIQDIAFDQQTGIPLLLASDGGVHLTRDQGAHWEITGSGRYGHQALQIYKVIGQFKVDSTEYDHTDLYFGTHDNRLWYSLDGGRNWLEKADDPEGGGLRALRKIDDYDDAWITGYRCYDCYSFISEEHFRNSREWQNAGDVPGMDTAIPLDAKSYIQFGVDAAGGEGTDAYYLYLSDDFDHYWDAIHQVDKKPWGQAKLSNGDHTWVTSAINTGNFNDDGSELLELRSISNIDSPASSQLFHSSRDFGSLGLRGYGFEWTPVFGVNPANPNHIIAPDILSKTMKVSIDGGETWSEDADLTRLLTDNGKFDLYAYHNNEYRALLVTEISFLPENPNHILIGTKYNGIIKSADGGLTWEKLRYSERIPHITSFFWDYPNGRVIVSSYGRGLWVLDFGKRYFDRIPNDVLEIPEPDPDRVPWAFSARELGIRVRGAAMINGMPLIPAGGDLMITGIGFQPSPDQQSPVELWLEGEPVAQVFPDADGRFETDLQISLPDGSYILKAIQHTPEGSIRQATRFQVASLDE